MLKSTATADLGTHAGTIPKYVQMISLINKRFLLFQDFLELSLKQLTSSDNPQVARNITNN